MADEPTESLPTELQNKINNEQTGENLSDGKDPESSVDVLGLLAEAVSRERVGSDEEIDAEAEVDPEYEEFQSPDSACEQEESNDAGEDINLPGENEDDQQYNDQNDEIDINEDFTLQFDNEEESSVNEEISINNTLITEVVSLAPTETPEVSEDVQDEINSKEHNIEFEEPKNSVDESPTNDNKSDSKNTASSECPPNAINLEKPKLSEDIIKGLREEAQRLAAGVSKEDLENLGKEIQNAMKTLFGDIIPMSDNTFNNDDKKLDVTPKIDSAMSVADTSKENQSMEMDVSTTLDEAILQKDADSELLKTKKTDNEIKTKTPDVKSKSKEIKSSKDVVYVDLDESSSDSEATRVKVPTAIEVNSSNTSNNSTVAPTDDTGARILSGLPSTSLNKTSKQLNMAELTISSVSTTSETKNETPMEILNLDSDDEDMSKKESVVDEKMDTANDEKNNLEKIDEKPEPKNYCVNVKCESKSDTPMQLCPIFILGMYNKKRKRKMAHPKICQECFNEAINETELLVTKFKYGKPVMKIKHQDFEDSVEVLDSDSDEEDKTDEFIPLPGYDPLTAEELEFVTENLPDVMEDVCRKYKFDEQIQMCTEVINNHAKLLGENTSSLLKECDALEKNLYLIRDTLYNTIKITRQYEPELLIPLDVDFVEESVNSEKNNMEVIPVRVPPIGVNKFDPLKVGDSVYAMKHSLSRAWVPATIEEISIYGKSTATGSQLLLSKLAVTFYIGERKTLKTVMGNQIAYHQPCKYLYKTGSRVIALFKDNITSQTSFKKDSFFSGIIAEIPASCNKYRYLVFFDDGYSRYVYHQDILLICEYSENVWEEVELNSQVFLKKYLTSYPEIPMVRVEIGHILKVEKSGEWRNAIVRNVDSSLALLQYENSELIEWIHRGSTRLMVLFQQMQAVDRAAHGTGRQRTLRTTNHSLRKMNIPYVEYKRIVDKNFKPFESEQSEQPENKINKPLRAVAKKSTSTVSPPKEEDLTPEVMDSANMVRSRVVYYSPKIWIHPKKMVPHECGTNCLNRKTPSLMGLRSYHPLAKPLLTAWERLIIKIKYKRVIMYRAPCGRRLRNIQEVHKYLRMTESEMSVDLFDFDFRVHCLAEFVPTSCFVKKADISHGVEAMAVPCVNYYDHSLPEFWSYSTSRQPTEGVDLNLDENFLCGCDCTDDCRDKEKCQCWKLTYEGTRFIGMKDENVGYEYRRLYEQVPTGIYECNSRCKCASTCLNRVVQHPLQLKLQVFKTYNKGWGIRALNDIPRGCFICVYAGNLLTDAAANDGGKKVGGDKYLADLDYIEVVEKLKEGYELDIPEEDKILDKAKNDDKKENDKDDEDEDDQEEEDGKEVRAYNRPDSDEEFSPEYLCDVSQKEIKTRLRARQTQKNNTESNKVVAENSKTSENLPKVKNTDDSITISDDEENVREPSRFAAPEGFDDDEYVPRYRSVRSFYGDDDACFIMDARVTGNIGRYLNHSCSPNVFVQNVFVDTHDPRFPWVAFFALEHICTGTELTWNYNYDIGSVPGKVIYCKCAAPNCRGRLL